MSKRRAIVIVIDSMGIGALPDCAEFGDVPECNTLKNVCAFNNGLDVPVLEAMGLGNIQGVPPQLFHLNNASESSQNFISSR